MADNMIIRLNILPNENFYLRFDGACNGHHHL